MTEYSTYLIENIDQQIIYSEGDVLGEEDETEDGFQMLSGAAAGEGEDAMSLTSVPRSRRKIEFSIVLTKTDHLSRLDLVEVRTILCVCDFMSFNSHYYDSIIHFHLSINLKIFKRIEATISELWSCGNAAPAIFAASASSGYGIQRLRTHIVRQAVRNHEF